MKPLAPGDKQQFIQEGYLIVRNLLSPDLVASTHVQLLAALNIDPAAPETWQGKAVSSDPAVLALTAACRTEEVEQIAEQLVGPHFVHGQCLSPYLEAQNIAPALIPGYIPVLNFPTPGPRQFQKPDSYHIDGMHRTTLWPDKHFLVVFAYLTDVADYGGATTVLPGSHRQIFEHWVRQSHPGSGQPPALDYADPLPLSGGAGDVLFLHYLTAHSGSPNHSEQIRVGLNTAVMPDPNSPYRRREGAPRPDWTPLDHTLRTDNLTASV